MTRLLWNRPGERTFETGIDRGVLYLGDSRGVSWNGLVSVDEDLSDLTSEAAYFDGVKYADIASIGDYSASLSAYTYPDEFMEYEGVLDLGNGLLVDGQDAKLFGLSYRTRIGNDILGTDFGYKIHLVYNLTAIPDDKEHETVSDVTQLSTFSWNITGVPEKVPGYRPTAHVILDSRYLSASVLTGLEDILYGDADTAARLPSLTELVDVVTFWDPKLISNFNTTTGIAELVDGMGDLTQINTEGVFTLLSSTRLVQVADGYYELQP